MRKYKVLDLFCGAGGLSIGFERNDFEVVKAIDFAKHAVETYNFNRKEKVAEYINNLDADYGEKIILFKSEYNADDTYNYEIIDYLNNREDISYEEMVAILKELGFTVKGDTVTWD